MKWLSIYRGYEIRHSTVRDGDGFARYDAEIKVGGEWHYASCEALDDDTVERDLDAFIGKLEAATHLSRQPQAAPQNGDHKWCASRDGHTRPLRTRRKAMNAIPSTSQNPQP